MIEGYVARTDPANLKRGGLHDVAVNFAQGTNLEWASIRLKALCDKPTGAMFWMFPMVLVMNAGEDNLSDEDWSNIRQAWTNYFPYRGDTENHWLMYLSLIHI